MLSVLAQGLGYITKKISGLECTGFGCYSTLSVRQVYIGPKYK